MSVSRVPSLQKMANYDSLAPGTKTTCNGAGKYHKYSLKAKLCMMEELPWEVFHLNIWAGISSASKVRDISSSPPASL